MSQPTETGCAHTFRITPKGAIDSHAISAYKLDHFTVVTDDADEPFLSVEISCAQLETEFAKELHDAYAGGATINR